MKTVAMILCAFAAVSCSSGGGGSNGGAPIDEPTPLDRPIYRCDSQNSLESVSSCLSSDARVEKLARRIATWHPQQGAWLSLQLESKYMRQNHELTDTEINCLTQKFCKEKLP